MIIRGTVCFLLALVTCEVVSTTTDKAKVAVITNDGTFVGYVYEFESMGRKFATKRFLGIPYAEAPVGNLRFNKPMRKAKLTNPHDATEFGPSCLHIKLSLGGSRKPGANEKLIFSEDCLVLNIFTPANDIDSNELLSVMVYFHGGGFNMGTPTIHTADIPSAYGNVVVVTVSYRLSIWGFLSTGDENLPGNYGLWDQHMAIEWVYDNIGAFGGNPEEIAIFGQSAGGASVVYQAMFPGNLGKVRRVIPMSGSITCPWAFNSNPLKTAKRLANLVGCDTTVSTIELADCLKSKSTQELEIILNTKENGFVEFPMEFVSVVDRDFIPESPFSLLHGSSDVSERYRSALRNVDLMTGITSEEGLMMLYSFVGVENTETYEADRSKFETELVPEVARIVFGDEAPDIIKRLMIAEYTNWTDPDNSFNSLKSYVSLSGDYVFNIQTLETALLHAESSRKNTYLYLYDVFPSTRIAVTPPWNQKPQHGDEVTTFFGYNSDGGYTAYTTPYIEEPYEDWETEFIKAHITMWTNFAKSGNPNEPVDVKSYINTTWPKYNTESQRYLRLARPMSEESVGSRLCARATNFWWNVLPGVVEAVRGDEAVKDGNRAEFCLRDGECEP